MFDISCEINGRRVNPNNIANALEAAILNELIASVRRSIGSIVCKEHRKSPSISIKGRNINSLSFEVSGCCDQLANDVKSRLKSL